ncbi:MAG: UDP-N-acetylmuramoyl-L-alanyl-D-glutamate--2,6-diaminopimelate ligase [Balneolaceae bacterium]|nr:UDP-N-acetylmuramoyl-L-alanyl-D-glutamate--2,6-diaminopimelate ligase [Balneolaceae bacterium]
MKLPELIELCQPLHVTNSGYDGELGAFVLDSRKIEKDDVFIAVRGTQVDGHMFLDDAIDGGVRVIITEDSFYSEDDSVCVIEVENTRSLVGPLAQAFAGYPAKNLRIVGITGTNGKTTTATLVYQVLCACNQKASLLGTVNKRILDDALDSKLTTSDPIELAADMKAMNKAGSEFLIMEVSSHAIDQQRVAGFDFEVAAYTNLSHDHLDYHETIEEYASAKKQLFDTLPKSSTAVINMDDNHASFMIQDCEAQVERLSFETGEAHILSNSPKGVTFVLDNTQVKSPLAGKFNAYNVAEAYLICKSLGLDSREIAEALQNCPGAPGRMETIHVEGETLPLVIVDYAHTPDALKNVLSTLKSVKEDHQKLIVIFGAGGNRDAAKRPEMAKTAAEHADQIVVTSDNPRKENPDLIIADILDGFANLGNVKSITDRGDAIKQTIAASSSDDIILIAGKGHEDYQEINGIEHPFDDRKVAREALKLKAKEVH